VLDSFAKKRVILFGLGGVGSWCAEGLIRNGFGDITIVDSDYICATNINRQIHATSKNIGKPKTEIMSERLREINPQAKINTMFEAYHPSTKHKFDLSEYDYVLDAIDTLNNKVELISSAVEAGTTLFSSLGASCKLDPTRIRTGSLWDVRGCPLGKHLRKRVRNRSVTADIQCVYSDENLPLFEVSDSCGTGSCVCPEITNNAKHDWCEQKKQINGSSVHVTAAFGFVLCGLVIDHIRSL